MPQIMPKSYRFGQIFIQPKRPRDSPGYLSNFKGVGQACSVVIPLRRKENLRFVFQPPESFAMYDSVSIPLIAGAKLIRFLFAIAPPGSKRKRGV